MKLKYLLFIFFYTNVYSQCITNVATGAGHSCVLKDGTLWSWGRNTNGQLGDNSYSHKNIPTQIGTDNNWMSLASFSGYQNSSMAIKTNGSLWGWGINDHGQLGDGTLMQKNVPTQIGVSYDWLFISCGNMHTLGIKTNGTLWGWGNNIGGEIGDGTTIDRLMPVQVGNETNWAKVAAGGYNYSIGLKQNGTLWVWGSQSQINLQLLTPTQLGSDTNWIDIDSGNLHTIALKNDGTIWAYAVGPEGQLGLTSSVYSTTTMAKIGNDSDWKYIEAGTYRTFAIKEDGSLWGWGSTRYYTGQNSPNIFVPTQIGNDYDWESIFSGATHNIGIKTNGTVMTWGGNAQGDLGNGTFINNLIPTPIEVCEELNSNTIASDENEFIIFPNPARETVYLVNKNNLNIQKIMFYDVTMKKVLEVTNNFSAVKIDNLKSGIYFIKVDIDSKNYTYKLIKM